MLDARYWPLRIPYPASSSPPTRLPQPPSLRPAFDGKLIFMWPDQDETRELLRDARGGDQEAVNRLLDRHRDSLHRMIQSRLNRGMARRADASDVVQDALLTASRRLSEYLQKPTLPFHAWLRHLARDRLADEYRRQLADKRDVAREQSVGAGQRSSIDPVVNVPDMNLTPAAMLLRKEIAERFHAAIAQLPDDAKEIILMRHAEQLTNSQVAELLGLTEAAAGMRYLRALRQLRPLLGDSPSAFLE
jgi:RNA polymerase sigma-70 factor, ECF subfamily